MTKKKKEKKIVFHKNNEKLEIWRETYLPYWLYSYWISDKKERRSLNDLLLYPLVQWRREKARSLMIQPILKRFDEMSLKLSLDVDVQQKKKKRNN